MSFAPEFYAMVAAFWFVYEPIVYIWLGIVFGVAVILSFAIGVFHLIKPFLP